MSANKPNGRIKLADLVGQCLQRETSSVVQKMTNIIGRKEYQTNRIAAAGMLLVEKVGQRYVGDLPKLRDVLLWSEGEVA